MYVKQFLLALFLVLDYDLIVKMHFREYDNLWSVRNLSLSCSLT